MVGLEGLAGVVEQLSVARMVGRLDPQDACGQGRMLALEVVHELVLGGAWTEDDQSVRIPQTMGDAVEEAVLVVTGAGRDLSDNAAANIATRTISSEVL